MFCKVMRYLLYLFVMCLVPLTTLHHHLKKRFIIDDEIKSSLVHCVYVKPDEGMVSLVNTVRLILEWIFGFEKCATLSVKSAWLYRY